MRRVLTIVELGLGGTLIGFVVSIGDVIAQAAGPDAGVPVGDWVSSGATGAAAAALGYIVKKLTDGTIVFSDTAKLVADLTAMSTKQQELIDDANVREDRMWAYMLNGPPKEPRQ